MTGETGNVRLVIIFLGLVVLIGIAGGIYLASDDKTLPDALIAIVGAAGGSLASILAKTSTGAQDVRVVDEPVEVAQVPAKPKRTTRKKAGT